MNYHLPLLQIPARRLYCNQSSFIFLLRDLSAQVLKEQDRPIREQRLTTSAEAAHKCWPVKSSRYFRRAVRFSDNAIQTATGERNIYMSAYEGHLRIICAVCERLIQPGRKGSDTVVAVCNDCKRQSHFEAKHHQARQLRKNQQESGSPS